MGGLKKKDKKYRSKAETLYEDNTVNMTAFFFSTSSIDLMYSPPPIKNKRWSLQPKSSIVFSKLCFFVCFVSCVLCAQLCVLCVMSVSCPCLILIENGTTLMNKSLNRTGLKSRVCYPRPLISIQPHEVFNSTFLILMQIANE